jgi:hypothetical protein
LLIGSKTAKLHDIASEARRDAVVQIHFVTLLVLTSLGQVKKEWKPAQAPPPATQTINVGVRVAGPAEIRTISLAQPAPPALADEEVEQPPLPRAPRPMRLNSMVVERENFDRWLFLDERSESDHWAHLDEILRVKVEFEGKEHTLTDR